MRKHGRAWLALLTFVAPAPLGAQAPARCDPGQSPPGTSSNRDVSRSFCSITRRPMPIEVSIPSTLPHWTGFADVSAMLVVTSYGTVDRRLTRPWTYSGGAFGVRGFEMNDSLMAALGQFRFTPGFAGDTAVRSALGIHIITHGAPDTLPATATWRYVVGTGGGDTLYLDWIPGAALPPGQPDEVGAVIAVAVAELGVTELFRWTRDRDAELWTGCSAVGPGIPNATAVQAWLRRSGVALAGEGSCAPFLRRHAVEWTRLFRVAPSVYMVRFVAPERVSGKCRVEQRANAWTAACG